MKVKPTYPIRMVATDLDGTLLNGDRKASEQDLMTLNRLGELGILRVLATGRSLFSLRKVVQPGFPIDYVAFSSGAGIMDWASQELLVHNELEPMDLKTIISQLIEAEVDFMVQKPIPDNHHFFYFKTKNTNPDFLRRIDLYRNFVFPLDPVNAIPERASQIVVITPPGKNALARIENLFSGHTVLRTTSPLDHSSMWIEIFPQHVSKSSALKTIASWKHLKAAQVLAIGNDYNDLDMLEWAGQSIVVDNAADDLQTKYRTVRSHNHSGFSEAVGLHIDLETG